MSDRAVEIAKMEKERAEAARSRAQRADEAKKAEEKKRREAEQWAQTAKGSERRTKERYTALFYGISIFTVTLAVLTAYSRSSVLAECGRWFSDRGGNLISFFVWLGEAYQTLADNFATLFDGSQIVAHGLSIIILGAVAAGIGIGGVILARWIVVKARAIREEYEDGTFKGILTASIAISLFYVCLFLYEPIKSVLPLNIFSVWLLLSIIGAGVVNWKEIKGGVERGY